MREVARASEKSRVRVGTGQAALRCGQMSTVAVAGGSGVVGARVVQHLLARDDVEHVVAVGRRELAVEHAKLASRIVDLQSAMAIARELPDDVSVAFCCLGTTMKKAGSKEAFRAVDFDAVVSFGEAAREKGAQRLLLVSAIGADANARTFYLRTKGEAEDTLAQLGFPQLAIVRPSLIDDEGSRSDFRFGERLGLPLARAVFSIVGKEHRYAPISADTIAKALVRLAFDDSTEPRRIVESDALHALGA
jgi:uncharacterized protein YbjT (DUF2867 family)